MSVQLYERGRKVIHAGCPIEWDLAMLAEVVLRQPVKIRIVVLPVVPGMVENWRCSAKCV